MFKSLLKKAARLALKLADREIDRILAKTDRPADVTATRIEAGVVLEGPALKERAVTDPAVRDAAR